MINMIQYEYAVKDIRRNKRFYSVLFIQFLIVSIVLGVALSQMIWLSNGVSKLNNLREQSSFLVVDRTNDNQMNELFKHEKENSKKIIEFINEIDQNGYSYYIKWEYPVGDEERDRIGKPVTRMTVNENYLSLFRLKYAQGNGFVHGDYEYGKVIPIIVGNGLKEKYHYGSKFEFRENGKKYVGKVVGVLKKNTTIISMSDLTEIDMDDFYIRPFNIREFSKEKDLATCDMALNSLIVLSENSNIVEMNKKLDRMDVFESRFEPVKETIDSFVEGLKPQMEYELFLSCIILGFVIMSIGSNFMIIVEKNLTEIAVHIHVGAQMSSIVSRMLIQLNIVIVAAMLPSFFVLDIVVIGLLLLVFALLEAIIIIPFIVLLLRKIDVVQVIRRYE